MDSATRRSVQWLLRSHDGVITLAEAIDAGMTQASVRYMVNAEEWLQAHPRVYVDATMPPSHSRDLRAALAALPAGALASHGSAAWLQGIVSSPPGRPHVTVPYGWSGRLKRVKVHRTRVLPPSRKFAGLPCTEPGRTLVDLAASMKPAALDSAVDRALAGGLVRLSDLDAITTASRRHRRAGIRALRRSLAERGYVGAPEPSVLESWMARLQQARDHARLNCLVAGGWRVLVYTWKHLQDDPEAVISEIAAIFHASALA